jgi:hypothetical protein
MRGVWIAGAILVTLVTVPAQAEPRPYRGPHPIDLEGRWHDESAVHVHDDLPVGLEPFASIDGVLVFLADPVGYGWAGETWTYRGAHPLPPRLDGTCGISAEHRHPFAPEGDFRRGEDGVYRFTGALRGGEPTSVPGRVAAPGGATASTIVAAPPPAAVGIPMCSPDVPIGIASVDPLGGGVEVVDTTPRRRGHHVPPPRALPERAQGRRHSAGPVRYRTSPPVRRRQPPAPIPWPI